MSEWHHGYVAGDILHAVARAFEEAADSRAYLPDFPEFTVATEWLRATSRLVEERARDLSPTAHGLVSDICLWLLESGRALIGTPLGGDNRLDYLLVYIANREPDWIEPLKRRKNWLSGRKTSALRRFCQHCDEYKARAERLAEALYLIESAKDRGFGIDYARGVAQSVLLYDQEEDHEQ